MINFTLAALRGVARHAVRLGLVALGTSVSLSICDERFSPSAGYAMSSKS